MVVLGGLGHIWGGIIGAVIITIVYDLTRPLYKYQLLIFGLTIVLTILFMPKGIGGFIDRYFLEKRFKNGDWIHVDNIVEGTVERIGFRSTLVRRFDSSPIMVPNFNFAENAVFYKTNDNRTPK